MHRILLPGSPVSAFTWLRFGGGKRCQHFAAISTQFREQSVISSFSLLSSASTSPFGLLCGVTRSFVLLLSIPILRRNGSDFQPWRNPLRRKDFDPHLSPEVGTTLDIFSHARSGSIQSSGRLLTFEAMIDPLRNPPLHNRVSPPQTAATPAGVGEASRI